ncbi:hypothetical protein BS17DRAFT_782798 [Gyrodon lividus]|nr:hypothetical protein BS17DRAFT_782798 [Gyrodon lividus]
MDQRKGGTKGASRRYPFHMPGGKQSSTISFDVASPEPVVHWFRRTRIRAIE